jgi:hypothetical protein
MVARGVAVSILMALPAALPGAETTFYRDVLPVLQARCQSCHRPDEIGPMPLLTYAQTRPWAKAIKEAVLSKRMPPWFADPHYGEFSNDLSLSAGEIRSLVAWVDGGAREGKASDAPKSPATLADGWRIPKPDAVFQIPEEIHIPQSGIVNYMYIAVPTGFTEDHWVEMAEVRPTNRTVVHHAIVYVQDDSGWLDVGQYLAGYAPGAVPQEWKPGQARLIKAGSKLIFQLHYTTNGKPAVDRTQLGLIFSKQPAKERVVAMAVTNHWFMLPPGAPDVQVDARLMISEPMTLVGLRPHMHLRGKSFEFRAVFPDGATKILLRVPRYDFHWQPYYYLKAPIALPRGTRIECTAHFDNSPNNPNNPDPNANVAWGEQSWDEMMVGWMDVAVPASAPRPNSPVGALRGTERPLTVAAR